jgi:hypothetical protein
MDHDHEADTAMTVMGMPPTGPPASETRLPSWTPFSDSALAQSLTEWVTTLAQMLLHSTQMSGAAFDAALTMAQAEAMAPVLAQVFPLEDLAPVYERAVMRMLSDPGATATAVTARDLISAWHLLQSERQARAAAVHERKMIDYRMRTEAELRKQPHTVHHIGELAQRDGVALPYTPGAPRSGTFQNATGAPVVAPKDWEGGTVDEREAARQARVARNLEAWHALAAEHEHRAATQERKVSARRRSVPREPGRKREDGHGSTD